MPFVIHKKFFRMDVSKGEELMMNSKLNYT